ncbi:MAG: peptidoglycan DD-metalloendopeptidase family protein [Methylobacter sp.]|jgi:lipoprotein NlpD|nr:peptidoglycan DD-metalloendopeptidase family protein [Methylobacter sp.]
MTASHLTLIFAAVLFTLLSGCAEQPIQPPPPASVYYPPTQPDNTVYHSVKRGDTLYAISRLFNLDYRQLAQWNQIPPPYRIEIGQKIRLSDPNKPNTTPLPRPSNAKNRAFADTKPKIVSDIKPKAVIVPTTRIASQKEDNISFDNKATSADSPPNKAVPINNITEKPSSLAEKKSVISIDNETMLKLNFQWPLKGKILKSFSKADSKGIEIAGKIGQDVHAAEAGKVVYSGQGLIGYGNLLIIKHNDVYLSAYANNSELLTAEGHSVKKGDIIAKVGQVSPKKPSLYFEIRKNGKPVNPLNILPGK